MCSNVAMKLFGLVTVFCSIHRGDGFHREASVRKGGALVESLAEVVIPEDVVTVKLDISKIDQLPECLAELKGVLETLKPVSLTSDSESAKQLLQWAVWRSNYLINSIESQLPFNAINISSNNDRKTSMIFLQSITTQEKTINFLHTDLFNNVTQTCDLTKQIRDLTTPSSSDNTKSIRRTYHFTQIRDLTTPSPSYDTKSIWKIYDLLYKWHDDFQTFFNSFIVGLKASNEGHVLPAVFPKKVYHDALLKWQLEPFVNPEEDVDLYYKLLECYYMKGLMMITIPSWKTQSSQSKYYYSDYFGSHPYSPWGYPSKPQQNPSPKHEPYTLSRILPFPVPYKDSFLLMKVNSNPILTLENQYAYTSEDKLKYCKKLFPSQSYYLCPPSLFEFYDQSVSPSCESDIFFRRNTVSSCIYSYMDKIPQPFSLFLGYSYYLYFPSKQSLRITCSSTTQTFYYDVQGHYVMNGTCKFWNTNPFGYSNLEYRKRPLKNISSQVEIPTSWDISELKMAKEKEVAFNAINILMIINIIMTVALTLWLCVYVRDCKPRAPWLLCKLNSSTPERTLPMNEMNIWSEPSANTELGASNELSSPTVLVASSELEVVSSEELNAPRDLCAASELEIEDSKLLKAQSELKRCVI